ncbi:GIY-YIG nuclease family protein [Gordonia terrae]
MTQDSGDETPILYRFFDENRRLLYIGITMNPPARFRQHHAGKVWWHTVTTITLESFSSRVQLASAERAAILLERPLHNIAGNSHGRLRPEMCPACDKPSWYDPVADVYRHELSTKPIHELPRDGQTVRCYLSIVQQGVNHT